MAVTLTGCPRDHGFRMPAEFEPHQGCWMLWPCRLDTWRAGAVPAQQAFAQVAEAISRFEPVTVAAGRDQFDNARQRLPAAVRVVEISSDDSWMRDVGPTFVCDDHGRVRGIDWDFNAYGGLNGGLYFPWDQDQGVAGKVLEIERTDRYCAPLVMEGGALHVDGQGALITTEQCLLNPNRNPGLSRVEIESYLRQYLGVETIIWLPEGVFQDETDGHVDNLCAFVRPAEVMLTWTDDVNDPQYDISRQAYDILSKAVDARGRRIVVHKIHQPGPLYLTEAECRFMQPSKRGYARQPGERMAASYVNCYLANGAVIVPVFNDPQDQPALDMFEKLFPNRPVVGVESREILIGGGNIHCITQQQPTG